MSKAVDLLKLFFSLVSINSTNLEQLYSENSTGESSAPVTNTPIILKQMDRRLAEIGQASSFTVSINRVYKINEVDLKLLTRHNGQIPPSSWIRFNKKRRTVFMFPLEGNDGNHVYHLFARHLKSNIEETKKIEIRVRNRTSQPNHEFLLKTKLNFHKFKTDVMTRYDFVERVADYAVSYIDGVFLRSFNEEKGTITVSFNTVRDTSCNLKAIRSIAARLVDSKGRVKRAFKKALSSKFIVTGVLVNLLGPCFQEEKEEKKFDWGIWRHLLPPIILIGIIGGPVAISCIVKKYPGKRRRIAGNLPERKTGGKNEDFEGLFDKAVRYNTRRPSFVSVLANEDADIPNGSLSNMSSKVSSGHPNVVPNGMAPSVSNNRKVPDNKKKEVYIGKSEFNIPCYLNFDPNQPPEPEKSMMDSTFESFGEFAGAISSKLKDIKGAAGKSVVNMSSLFGTNTEDDPKDGTESNPETNVYDPNNSLTTKVEPSKNEHEKMVTTTITTAVLNPQYSELSYGNQLKTQISSKNIAKSEDQLPKNSELMQNVMERITLSSQRHYGNMPQESVHNNYVRNSSKFGPLHIAQNSITNTPSHPYRLNDHRNIAYYNTTRALNVNVMEYDPRFKANQSNVMPHRISLYSNTSEYQPYFNELYPQQGKMPPDKTHIKSQIFEKGFDTASRHKCAILELPDHHRLHPGNKLSRSLNDLSPRFGLGNNLEHSRVLSKSDLCLYQSNSDFISNTYCDDSGKRDALSIYNCNGCYDIDDMDVNATVEPNAFDDPLPESTNIYSEDHTPYFYQTENLMEHSTLSNNWITEQEISNYLNSADGNAKHEIERADMTEPPVLTVDDYGVEVQFADTSDRDNLNYFTTKSMLSLPGGTRDSKNQYEFGFTPTSSYEDTRETYHEYVNVLYSGNGSGCPPPISSKEIRETTYWSGGVEYHSVHTDPYLVEDEHYYNQQPELEFAKSMPDLAQKHHGYSTNPININSNSRKHYQSKSKDEEHSLLAKDSGSKQTTNQPSSSEDTTVVGFIKTKMSGILG